MRTLAPDPFLAGLVYGEGPRWHDGRLWFTDGLAGRVCSAGASGDLVVEATIPRASGLGWLPDRTLVVSTLFEPSLHYVDPAGSASVSDLSGLAWSTNDMVVAPDGRTYVDLYRLTDGGLVGDIALIDSDRTAHIVATGLALPNGLGFLPDGATLVVSETRGSRILAFRVEPDGSLGEAEVFADLGPGRHPDGLCVDVEGGVWVGCYDSAEFLRVTAGGTITHRIPIDTGWAVAPALGGADGRTLYLVIDDTDHAALTNGESTGWIMQARVEIPGAGSP
ncbi:SMP-30/gluconolactonase/LRE family protein [Mycobacterium sp. ACS4331]|uniref:SMP-30/gluconolactonase/LRE family protein n=1 Tax=Mycobacterium sp. ACS4331 TaxID=1834121 RepID=UPI0008004DBD|nr:SMP-30/gluconolactonase/LRE family protein [Mycobacterium sp. ACS4331]OBF22224.1 gluconolaconase [Mycobacterium sp. ACS4331]